MAAQAPQPTTVRDMLAVIGKLYDGFRNMRERRGVFDEAIQRYEWARDRGVSELEDLEDRYENLLRAAKRGMDVTLRTWQDLKNVTLPDAMGVRSMNIDDAISERNLDIYTRFVQRHETMLRSLEAREREIEQTLIMLIKWIDARFGPLVPLSAPDQEQPPPPPPPDADVRNRSMYGFGRRR